MTQHGTLVRCALVVAVVAALPWIAALFPDGGAFGFPFPALVMLIAGPLLLVVLAGGTRDIDPGASEARDVTE